MTIHHGLEMVDIELTMSLEMDFECLRWLTLSFRLFDLTIYHHVSLSIT